jgi:hypothetical protein
MQAEPKRDESSRWRLVAAAAIIVGAVLLVYLPALRAGFVWDDEQLITSNPLLRTFSGLIEIWSGGRTADYFPITNTAFWIEHHLFGDNPLGYHALNILLQAADAVLVWLVLRRLQIPGAWLAGLIFGIHPVHVESVAWISELKNVLAMFFTLLSILCFVEIDEKPRSRTWYILSLIFFALALLSKTQVVFMPMVLVLCLWWRARDFATLRREAIRTWPFFVMAAVFGLITIWFQNRGIGEEEIIIGSVARRFVNAGMAVWWYAGKVFLPARPDGDLSALALRFARSVGVAAVDCAGFADWPALVFPKPRSARRFCCRRIFCGRALASDWARSNGLPAQWDAGRGPSSIFCRRFAHRACLRRRDDACQSRAPRT